MDLSTLEGTGFGPQKLRLSPDSVADFVEVTGDDMERWSDTAPPGFAAAALFRVAPELLDGLSDRFVVHGDQSFEWRGPLRIGSLLDVTGKVSRVRERAGAHFVVFEVEVSDEGDPVVSGASTFVVSGEAVPAAADFERPEPPHGYRGDPGHGQFAASRADLIRYAAATRDWNPIHWDHEAAVAAGFPGVVVHGLLQAAWALREVSKHSVGPRPLTRAKLRFRNPLLPARPVQVRLEVEDEKLRMAVADDDTEYLTGTATVVRG